MVFLPSFLHRSLFYHCNFLHLFGDHNEKKEPIGCGITCKFNILQFKVSYSASTVLCQIVTTGATPLLDHVTNDPDQTTDAPCNRRFGIDLIAISSS